MNINRTPRIEKITLNVGAGKNQEVLDKGVKLLHMVTGVEPVKTVTKKRIPTWGLRPGLPIGTKLTLRGKAAEDLLKRLLEAKDNQLSPKNFDDNGNISFGIPEYIDVPGVKYNPEIGMMGFEVSITLERPGFRVKRRRVKRSRIGKSHLITQKDAIEFIKNKFGVKVIQDDSK